MKREKGSGQFESSNLQLQFGIIWEFGFFFWGENSSHLSTLSLLLLFSLYFCLSIISNCNFYQFFSWFDENVRRQCLSMASIALLSNI